uniref:Uncharacterized protein n=1 Tax=viral metagenome TaxID=1070528 RepID=A0A6H1ZZU9_9ZZZZ
MGKKFIICEIEPNGEGWRPVHDDSSDAATWIDSRHVIDGDRLREATPLAGDRYFCPKVGWTIAPMNSPITALILDPPKPEGDEWQYLCPTRRDWENPDKWEDFKDDED